jgi:hypothetical protein
LSFLISIYSGEGRVSISKSTPRTAGKKAERWFAFVGVRVLRMGAEAGIALALNGEREPWPKLGQLRTSWPEEEPGSDQSLEIEPVSAQARLP